MSLKEPQGKEHQMIGTEHASANESEYYAYSYIGRTKWLKAHAMRNSKGELIDEVEKVDDSMIVLQQDAGSVSKLGDCIHLIGGRLVSLFVVHKRVLSVLQLYRLQKHAVIAQCRILDKRGKAIAQGNDYRVMHFSHDDRRECADMSTEPIIRIYDTMPYESWPFHRKLVPQLDFFQDVSGWIFSAALVERIQAEKFSNFAFDSVVFTD